VRAAAGAAGVPGVSVAGFLSAGVWNCARMLNRIRSPGGVGTCSATVLTISIDFLK